ncbi:MAG: hypothetical protein ABI836_03275 [Gemmatimonadota bacterium]
MSGSTFVHWSGDCSGTGACQLDLSRDRAVTADFGLASYPLTIAGGGDGAGHVSSTPAPALACDVAPGITTGACQQSYPYQTVVTLTASAANGSDLSGWSVPSCIGATCVVSVAQATTVTATFTLQSFTLTLVGGGDGDGTVTSQAGLTPAINCTISNGLAGGPGCSATYRFGTGVTLTAMTGAGSSFVGYSGNCVGASCSVTVQSDISVTATFSKVPVTATVTGTGGGNGRVQTATGITPALDCMLTAGATAGTCNASYANGTGITLTAAPGQESNFEGWSGDCSGLGDCLLTLSQDRAVSATFTLKSFTLTVSGTGSGTITSTGITPALSCTLTSGSPSGACQGTYDFGTPVMLDAVPAGVGAFAGWGGGCSNTSGPCAFTITQSTGVTAAFTDPNSLSILGSGNGTGTVSTAAGITPSLACTTTNGTLTGSCGAIYSPSDVVTLAAAAATGSQFTGWSGSGCSGTGNCVMTMSSPRVVTAGFTKLQFSLQVQGAGLGSGRIASQGVSPAVDCTITAGAPTGQCTQMYDYNTPVTLTATADQVSDFQGWSGGGCSGTGTCIVTLDQARSVVATFDLRSFTLTVAGGGNGAGTVASTGGISPAINCSINNSGTSGTCSNSYLGNQMVTLQADTSTGSIFNGWSGSGCAGVGTCTVAMSQTRSVTATFTLRTFTLTVIGSGTGSGTVMSQAGLTPAINCGITAGNPTGACVQSYNYNTPVTLTATQTDPSIFAGWSGSGCSGTGPCPVTMTQNRAVTAPFSLPIPTALAPWGTITYTAPAGGNVVFPPAVIVRDQLGRAMSNVSVTFQVTGGGGAIQGSPSPTGANGVAQLTSWTFGTNPGSNAVQASIPGSGLPPVSFNGMGNSNGAITSPAITSPTDTVTLKTRPRSSGSAVRDITVYNSGTGTLTLNVASLVTQDPATGTGSIRAWFLPGTYPNSTATASATQPATLRIESFGDGSQDGGMFFLGSVTLSSTTPGVPSLTVPVHHNFDDNNAFGYAPPQLFLRTTPTSGLPAFADVLVDDLNPPAGSSAPDTLFNLVDPTIAYPSGQTPWATAVLIDSIPDPFDPSLWVKQTPNHVRFTPTQVLSVGSHTATVTVTGEFGSPTQVHLPVVYQVDPDQVIELGAQTLDFTFAPGDASTGPIPVSVGNAGTGALSGLSASVPAPATPWLSATLTGSTAPSTLNITITPANIPPGGATADVMVSSTDPGVAPAVVTVTVR